MNATQNRSHSSSPGPKPSARLFAEVWVRRPGVGIDWKKTVSISLHSVAVEGLLNRTIDIGNPAIMGSEDQPGRVRERLMGLLPRELLHPETEVQYRVSNQFGNIFDPEDMSNSSLSSARKAAEDLFKKS